METVNEARRGAWRQVPRPVSEQPRGEDESWIEQLSWSPRAYLWHNMLSKAQCEQMIQIATPRMAKSKVVDSVNGREADDPIRTSYGAVLSPLDDEVLMNDVDAKSAMFAQLPTENAEQIQVLRYKDGQKYDAHWDQFDNPEIHKEFFKNGGQRVATILMYLSDVEEGGETVFPLTQAWLHPERAKAHQWSKCAQAGVAVKPHAGDALLFWGVLLDGVTLDKASMHAGCPVLKGTKYTATKWIHAEAYDNGGSVRQLKPGECRDLSDGCVEWARGGECKNNPDFMLGTQFAEPQCAKSCQVCDFMGPHGTVDRAKIKQQGGSFSSWFVRRHY